MRDVLDITKALADPNRLRILMALRGGELCACQIIELLGLAGSTVSQHLTLLDRAGLVAARKDGRWMYYSLARGPRTSPAQKALRWVRDAMQADPQIADDDQKLKQILKIDPEEICRRQAKSRCCSSAPATRAAARSRKAGRGRSKAT